MKSIMYIYFVFGPVVQEEVSFKSFLIWSSGGPPVQWSGTSKRASLEIFP